VEDIHHRQPDGTMIYGKRWALGKTNTAILIIPNIGETLLDGYYGRFAEHLLEKGTAIFILELRGHKLSEGEWSLHAYRADIAYWMAHFRSTYKHLYVVAHGFSASTMLEYDDQAHRFPSQLPPLPDGMVLIDPIFSGKDLLPAHGRGHKVARTLLGNRAYEKKLRGMNVRFADPKAFWKEMEAYVLDPVRIQTPSVLFVAGDELASPLKRVFGSVNMRRVTWLHHGTRAEFAKHARAITEAIAYVKQEGKPHRFRVRK